MHLLKGNHHSYTWQKTNGSDEQQLLPAYLLGRISASKESSGKDKMEKTMTLGLLH